INGGSGQQNLGASIARGDFNCDGLTDVAMSLPTATIAPSTEHYRGGGGVVIYYSYQDPGPCFDEDNQPQLCPIEFKTDGVPLPTNSYPNPTLVYYEPKANDVNFGVTLTTGNINGDCFRRSGTPAGGSCSSLFAPSATVTTLKNIHSCDDLVVGTKNNEFFVIYGDPANGLVSGSGASTDGDNELTCDPVSNTCRPVRISPPSSGYSTGTNSRFGQTFALGDFNNDGFDDLAITAGRSGPNMPPDILILRGSSQGLYPAMQTSGAHGLIRPGVTAGLETYGPIADTDQFGLALGVAFNSRKCENGGGYLYRGASVPRHQKGADFTKCDDLVIGSPGRANGRGSIFTCKASIPTSGTDRQQITNWICDEHYPDDLEDGARYGQVISGSPNLLGYPLSNIKSKPTDTAQEKPEIAGSVFVGAPSARVDYGSSAFPGAGKVYGYYITPLSTHASAGGIQGILGTGPHTVRAVNQAPCDRLNANVSSVGGLLHHCEHQLLSMSPPQSGANFGASISFVPMQESKLLDDPSLQMLAVGVPKRNIQNASGTQTLISGGSVLLFRPDLSTIGYEGGTKIPGPQRSYGQELDNTCTATCTWYAGGISPFGPSIFYSPEVAAGANFGLAGVVGGDFNGDSQGDVLIPAPNNDLPTPRNGGVYLFTSDGGFSPTETVPMKVLNANLGFEGNYNFEEAKVIGDLNGDGYEDIVTHINGNGIWSVVVYYGSPNGLITFPKPSKTAMGTQPLLLSLKSDSGFGTAFYSA
ncbi:MAG TPA: hypothetical protein PL182_11780, partial [Pseudobdellovibrionaceae bacterium]|nr:hypothetical protein [Pseudobdellovibrionaceae bacterium]